MIALLDSLKQSKTARPVALAAACLVLGLCPGCSSSDDGGSAAAGGTDGTGSGGSPGAGGGSSLGGGTSAGGSSGGSASVEPDPAVGYFNVTLEAPTGDQEGYTSVTGFVYEAAPNEDIVWDLADQQGDCRVLTPRAPFCDPACASGSTCVEDGVCQPNPALLNAGTVTITGLQTAAGTSEFSMTPLANRYQPVASIDILYPPCAEGAEVRLSAEGGDTPAFEVITTGISPLEGTGAGPIHMESGQAMALQWTAAGASADSTVVIRVDISHHGGAKGLITCRVADSGSFEIPASLVTQLINFGVAGFPTVVIRRESVGSASIDIGRIDLKVLSGVELSIEIPGLVSCTTDADCAALGQTCQANRACG